MIENLPTLLVGLAVPAALVFGAAFVLRAIRKGLSDPKQEYTGAMGSAAMEAMMNEARRQRAMLEEERDGQEGGKDGGQRP